MRALISSLTIVAMLATTACSTTGSHLKTAADPGPGYTKHVMYIVNPGFDDAGNMNPDKKLTREQAKMVGGINVFCARKTQEVEQLWMEYPKEAVKGGAILGLATAVGAVMAGFTKGPVVSFMDYFKYGAGSGAGSGIFTADEKVEQSLKIVDAYCKILMTQDTASDPQDGRLRHVLAVPVMVGRAKMPEVDNSTTSLTRAQLDEQFDRETAAKKGATTAPATAKAPAAKNDVPPPPGFTPIPMG